MSETFTHTLEIEINIGDGRLAIEAEVEYRCSPGYAGRGADLHQPGEPPEPAELEVGKVSLLIPDMMAIVPIGTERPINATDAPTWLRDFISNDDDIYRELGEACDWGQGSIDPDYERDRRMDDAAEDMTINARTF